MARWCKGRRGLSGRQGMIVQGLSYSGLGFMALVSSFVNRGYREIPRVAGLGSSACNFPRWTSRVRSFASHLPPKTLRSRLLLGGAMSIGTRTFADATDDDQSMATARTYAYDHLFNSLEGKEDLDDTALVVLNTHIDPILAWQLENVWANVDVIVCADGASNRLYEFTDALGEEAKQQYVPNVLCGDLDSLRPEVAEHYREKGTVILRICDEGTNDLEKCLQAVIGSKKAILFGGLGGRFDHEMGNINAMYKYLEKFTEVVLVGGSSLVQILGPGEHLITIDQRYQGPHCGIIPIGGRVDSVYTKGLKWDLKGQSLEFGGLVSSSNILSSNSVTINTSGAIAWTTSIRRPPTKSSC